jgi:hypothetical protein
VVEKTPLGRCVKSCLGQSEELLQHLFHLYTSDLLHFSFPIRDQEEHKVSWRWVGMIGEMGNDDPFILLIEAD